MVRKPSLKVVLRNSELLERIRTIKAEHPFWVYRRVWAWLYRTMKEECLWLQEWQSPQELQRRLNQWIAFYNNQYLHSTLGYKPPKQFESDYYATLLQSA